MLSPESLVLNSLFFIRVRLRFGLRLESAWRPFFCFGYWVWPAIFLGAFAVNMTTAGSITTSLGIATGNTLEGLLGAFLINHFANGRKVFTRQHDTLTFVLLAALLSTTVSATLGVTSLSLAGYAEWERTVRFG